MASFLQSLSIPRHKPPVFYSKPLDALPAMPEKFVSSAYQSGDMT
jgi:hypothetical protein